LGRSSPEIPHPLALIPLKGKDGNFMFEGRPRWTSRVFHEGGFLDLSGDLTHESYLSMTREFKVKNKLMEMKNMSDRSEMIDKQLKDHEKRIRVLEGKPAEEPKTPEAAETVSGVGS